MEAIVEAAPVPLPVVGRAILSRLDAEAVASITAAIAEEIRKEVAAECVAEARRQLEAEFAARWERRLDQLAKDRKQLEKEADDRIDQEVAAQVAAAQQDWEDRRQTLREQRQAWRTRAETAEGLLTDLLRQLVGPVDQRPVYLYSGGRGVQTLHKAQVNVILGYAGLRLRSKATPSERLVTVQLGDGREGQHSVFWLSTSDKPGVTSPPTDDEG